MYNILEIVDKNGRTIYLTNERWKHITSRHTEISSTDHIYETIVNPLVITRDEINKRLYKYHRYYKNKGRYLMVAIKYLNGKGFIVTSFYTKVIIK